ncbi:MAG: CoA pyrophosphatase [Flavobacteriales bacterium]|nr:CoA pyrophosphatase [Flavobacteriales bacterium]
MDDLSIKIQQALLPENRDRIAEAAHSEMVGYKRPIGAELRKHIPGDARESGVMMLITPIEGVLSTVLILRSTYKGVHSAQVSFPGGKREVSDSSLKFTAMREANEEIGLDLGPINYLGALSEVYIPPSNFIVQPHVFIAIANQTLQKDPREVAEIIHFPLKQGLLDAELREHPVQLSNGMAIESKAFHNQQHVIWGATAMMLNEFRHLAMEYNFPL